MPSTLPVLYFNSDYSRLRFRSFLGSDISCTSVPIPSSGRNCSTCDMYPCLQPAGCLVSRHASRLCRLENRSAGRDSSYDRGGSYAKAPRHHFWKMDVRGVVSRHWRQPAGHAEDAPFVGRWTDQRTLSWLSARNHRKIVRGAPRLSRERQPL